MKQHATFASHLRLLHRHRGPSQLQLAMRTGVSQRHVNFLELGRAAPSREIVIRLATALSVPLRHQNNLP